MPLDDATRQRLLELVYDLLPEAEAVELRKQIETDPQLAQAYSEAQAAAKLLGEAARFPAAKIVLRRPETAAATSADLPSPAQPAIPTIKANGAYRSPWARAANWAVGLAAAVLLIISVGGYWYHHEQLADIAAEHLRLVVTGPVTLHSGVAADYTVSTTAVTGTVLPAHVEFALYTPERKLLWGHKEKSDEQGRLQITVPKEKPDEQGRLHLTIPPDLKRVRLEVLAVHRDRLERVDTPLAVEPIQYLTQLAFDRPWYQPGETVLYRSLTLSRFGLAADREVPIHFAILGPDGGVVPGSQRESTPERGVGSGAFIIPDKRPGGQYTLSARSLDQSFPEQRQTFLIRPDRLPAEGDCGDGQSSAAVDDGGSPEPRAQPIPNDAGRVDVAFYPEGGDLVADLENRVYFVARNAAGKPVDIKGVVVNGAGDKVALVETTHHGMGLFDFTPTASEQYRLTISSPGSANSEPKLPKASTEQRVVLTTGTGIFEAREPLEFNIRAAKADLPLVVVASCRGVPVGQQMLVTRTKEGGANPVAVPVGEQVGGVIRLTVYDFSLSPPRPVAERLVYRRMPKSLKVEATCPRDHYAPGEKVDLALSVTNEEGRPIKNAVLSVAVVDDRLWSLAGGPQPAMPTYFLLTSEIEKPEDLENADFYLSDTAEAKAALDLLLGCQGWRRFAEKTLRELKQQGRDNEQVVRLAALGAQSQPPAMFDNLKQLRSNYDLSLAEYREHRTRMLITLTTVSFFGGLGLVLLVAMLGLLRIVWGIHLWMPAVGVTICCLIVGAILMDPSRLKPGHDGAVAFVPFHVPPPEPGKEPAREEKIADAAAKAVDRVPAPPAPALAAAAARKETMEKGVARRATAVPPGAGAGNMAGARNMYGAKQGPKPDAGPSVAPGLRGAAGKPVEPKVRANLAPTVFWRPVLVTGADGRANVSFTLPESAATFHILVDAHADGRIGSGYGKITRP